MFRRVAVVGLGLLGGSLCRALKGIDPSIDITAFARDVSKLEAALADRAIDRALPWTALSRRHGPRGHSISRALINRIAQKNSSAIRTSAIA